MESEPQILVIKIGNPPKKLGQKVAAFDYDGTLVVPNSNSPFPKDKDDWQWLRSSVPIILKDLRNRGYSIVVFTNQTKPFKLDMIKESLATLEIALTVFVSFKKAADKPNPRMFHDNIAGFNERLSFYVGDAAGRQGDWSDMDKIFAKNIGIPFKTPEEFFDAKSTSLASPLAYHADHQELVVMIGFPGSGKTTFAKTHLVPHNYAYIEGDVLKTPSRIAAEAIIALNSGKSAVIDSTNPTNDTRELYTNVAKGLGVPIRFFHINTTMRNAMIRNKQREKPVPDVVFYMYRKRFEEPTGENVVIIDLF